MFLRLPFSGGKYFVSINGVVKNKDHAVIPTSINLEGDLVVELNWFSGKHLYKVADVVAFSFKPTKVPLKYWGYLKVGRLDENKYNNHPINLVWKFPIGLGATMLNNFAYIPMYSRYMINREGMIFDTVTKKLQTGHFNKGYCSFSVMPDIGPRTCLKRHRGICLAFKDYPLMV